MTSVGALDPLAHQGLDAQQLGHLRHIQALARQLPNDWSGMQGRGTSQDDFGGYRFQLAYAAYALALTHRHRLPNAPGVFAPTFRRLLEKILLPEVWLYWRDVSRGGSVFNAHLVDQLHEEWDPVAQDNIMYSAYVQSMAVLYDVLFDDHRYAEPGSLSFDHWSFFWGGGGRHFAYDQHSLTEQLYWQMVRNGYVGIACEPNCIFQICNQPAIFGFRMHDLLTGGSRAEEVVAGYEQAWQDFGRLDADGHYNMMINEDSRAVRPNALKAPWVDAWCGALMNTWNRDFVRHNYPRQVAELLVAEADGTLSVVFPPPMDVMGRRVVNDTCDFGWVAAWASEMGDSGTLGGLLAHADKYMSPTWRDGALSYPRNDTRTDAAGHRTIVEPLTGNVLLAYARLNVPDGLWGLYNEPWNRSHFAEPLVTDVADDVDVTRAVFDPATRRLDLRLTRRTQPTGDGDVLVTNASPRDTVTIDGHAASGVLRATAEGLRITCPAGGPHAVVVTTDPQETRA
jgi:hypothetical protein